MALAVAIPRSLFRLEMTIRLPYSVLVLTVRARRAAIWQDMAIVNPLFAELVRQELPRGSYAIFGSGPLVVRGIVPDAGDLDVLCTSQAWSVVKARGVLEYLPDYGVTIATLMDGALTFGTTWGIGDFDVDELIATAEVIDELPFVRLEHVIRYKQIRNSEKDRRHLELLESHLNNV